VEKEESGATARIILAGELKDLDMYSDGKPPADGRLGCLSWLTIFVSLLLGLGFPFAFLQLLCAVAGRCLDCLPLAILLLYS
jgi:hypothetical protein